MTFLAVFKGGPYGGETRAWPRRDMVIRVPVVNPRSMLYMESPLSFSPTMHHYDTEEYEYERTDNNGALVYRWRNTYLGEVRKLRTKVSEQGHTIKELQRQILALDPPKPKGLLFRRFRQTDDEEWGY